MLKSRKKGNITGSPTKSTTFFEMLFGKTLENLRSAMIYAAITRTL